MCGLVGQWRLDGRAVDANELAAARDLLAMRGPDDAGLHVDGPLGMGHRRLSIIDLSPAGRMPMRTESGDVCGVFNGEIYNFAELRAELARAGHTFRSQTDSEVALHAYEAWGVECFARFDGMFAIALWDRRRRCCVLARDATGEKPLFYTYRPGVQLAFGSTLTSVLAFRDVERKVDPDALRLYAELGYVPAPHSIVAGVHKLAPASYAVFHADRAPEHRVYWAPADAAAAPRANVTLEEATDELHGLMRHAVRSRLVSDVPLGAFLSGGIDSSLIVALMAEAAPGTVRTFTIAFREREFDESTHAHLVAKHLGVENTMLVLSAADVLRELDHVTAALDEPMADYSALPSIAVARLARRHVTVALTGDGADEIFGGYRYYGATNLYDRVLPHVPAGVRRAIARHAGQIRPPRLGRVLQRVSAPDAASFFGRSGFYRGATANGSLARILAPGRAAVADRVADEVRAMPLPAAAAAMLWDTCNTLPGAWLTKVDRMTMAVALEARAPFLDRRVVEYGVRLPLELRLRGTHRKVVLKNLLARYLPRPLFERPKQGFTAPMKRWFAAELADELRTRLAPARIERMGIFDPAGVQGLLADQAAGRADHTQLLWGLFLLDRWFERNID